jgi:hypothetical protein
MRVELRAEARQDLTEGAWFYDGQSSGLGEYFVNSVLNDISKLAMQAGIHEVVYGFHCKPAKRFPFAIYYLVDDAAGKVDVVAVLDCRQDPQRIADRLR